MLISTKILDENLITSKEVSEILKCSRGNIERLQLKGLLNPVSTIYPKYYFNKDQVLELQKSLTSKKSKK